MAFWICTPTAGPFAGSHLSSIRPGQQTPCSQPGHEPGCSCHDRARDRSCGIRKKRELPPGSFGHCGAADGVCLGIPRFRLRDTETTSDLCLAKTRPSPPFLLEPLACICFSAVHTSGRNPWVLPPHRVRKAVVCTQHNTTLCRSRGLERRGEEGGNCAPLISPPELNNVGLREAV